MVETLVTRQTIEAAIVAKRLAQKRMPAHWEKRREEIAAELEVLVLEWLACESDEYRT